MDNKDISMLIRDLLDNGYRFQQPNKNTDMICTLCQKYYNGCNKGRLCKEFCPISSLNKYVPKEGTDNEPIKKAPIQNVKKNEVFKIPYPQSLDDIIKKMPTQENIKDNKKEELSKISHSQTLEELSKLFETSFNNIRNNLERKETEKNMNEKKNDEPVNNTSINNTKDIADIFNNIPDKEYKVPDNKVSISFPNNTYNKSILSTLSNNTERTNMENTISTECSHCTKKDVCKYQGTNISSEKIAYALSVKYPHIDFSSVHCKYYCPEPIHCK
jgi:hypothetical protein